MRNKFLTAEFQLKKLSVALEKHFTKNQIDVLMGKKIRRWDTESKRKAILIKQKVGDRNLKLIRKLGFPIPSLTSTKRTLRKLPFMPGLSSFNLNVLKKEYEQLPDTQKNVVIGFDGKHLVPGYRHQEELGKATIEPSLKSLQKNPEKIASQAVVYLLMGLNPRIKRIVDYEYVTDSTDPQAMLDKTLEVVKETEKQCGVKVRGIVFDLGCDNVSMLKLKGVDFDRKNFKYFIAHPLDSTRKLFLFPDLVHAIKNITCSLRLHKLIFSSKIVKMENLASNKTDFQDIVKVFEAQKNDPIKFTEKLTKRHIQPKHYETMREDTAYELLTDEVIQSIDMLSNSSKRNPTSFILSLLGRLKNIIFSEKGWTKSNEEEYEEEIKFLKYLAYDILPHVNFNNSRGYVKSLKGMIIAIRSMINLSEELWEEDPEIQIYPKYLLNNAVENQFSQVTHRNLKPDARDFQRAIKAMSLVACEEHVEGSSYSFDGKCESRVDAVELIEEISKKEKPYVEHGFELKLYDSPQVSEDVLFSHYLNRFGFHRDVARMINSNFRTISTCEECKNELKMISDGELHFYLPEKASKFFVELETLYRAITNDFSTTNESFKEVFLFNASTLSNALHCKPIQDFLVSEFLTYRSKKEIKARDKDLINPYGSRSLSNA
jgi:hypothetical protein